MQARAFDDVVGRSVAARQLCDVEQAHAARRPEIGLAHAMVVAHGIERAFGQHLALGHDDHWIAEMGDEAHVVLDQQHRDAASWQLEQPLADLVLQGRIDAGRRLVEQHQLGLGHQGAADLQ